MRAFEVMDVLAAARRRDERVERDSSLEPTCHLEIGQPAAPTPPAVLAAAADALQGNLGYTDTAGLTELRSAIADFHSRWGGPPVLTDRVIVTSGASAGCVLAFGGDR